ncbi:MAG: hypothetical protein GXY49_13600 [Syntrophomonadaceae bacterium]|nr:hypothetical protein [Syntrophomonadaceae bacterium]
MVDEMQRGKSGQMNRMVIGITVILPGIYFASQWGLPGFNLLTSAAIGFTRLLGIFIY